MEVSPVFSPPRRARKPDRRGDVPPRQIRGSVAGSSGGTPLSTTAVNFVAKRGIIVSVVRATPTLCFVPRRQRRANSNLGMPAAPRRADRTAGPVDTWRFLWMNTSSFGDPFHLAPNKREDRSHFLWNSPSLRAGLEPSRKGFRAFTRHSASQDVLHTDILVQIGPVNSLTSADEPVIGALAGRTLQQSGIPGQWHGNCATVSQINNQCVGCQSDRGCSAGRTINHQSIHAIFLRVSPDVLKSTCEYPSIRPG